MAAQGRALPVNVDPSDPKIDDPEERARMVRTFERGLSRPTGFVLPVQRWNAAAPSVALGQRALAAAARQAVPGAGRFAGRLSPADEVAALVPPADYPLSSIRRIRWSRAGRCPSRSISSRSVSAAAAAGRRAAGASTEQVAEDGAVRTALSVEPRDGVLCVFMPPVAKLDDYLELLAAVEETAREREHAGAHRRLSAAVRSAHRCHQGDARSRRDRGQYPSRRDLAPGGRDDRRRSTRTRASRGSAPTSS